MERAARRTSPEPPHVPQLVGREPDPAPLPPLSAGPGGGRVVLHRGPPGGLFDLGLVGVALDAEQGVVVARPSSSSPTRRLVWSTSATILSYGMRVGPMTPMTPANAPSRYEAVTSVKGTSLAS